MSIYVGPGPSSAVKLVSVQLPVICCDGRGLKPLVSPHWLLYVWFVSSELKINDCDDESSRRKVQFSPTIVTAIVTEQLLKAKTLGAFFKSAVGTRPHFSALLNLPLVAGLRQTLMNGHEESGASHSLQAMCFSEHTLYYILHCTTVCMPALIIVSSCLLLIDQRLSFK